MKKALKIIGITLGGLVTLFIIIGVIAVNSANKQEATAAYTEQDKAAITTFAKSEMDYWQRAIDQQVIEQKSQEPYKYVDLVATHFYMSKSYTIEKSANYEKYGEIRELEKAEKEMAHTLPQGKGSSYISQEQEQHIQEFIDKAQDLINTMGGLENE